MAWEARHSTFHLASLRPCIRVSSDDDNSCASAVLLCALLASQTEYMICCFYVVLSQRYVAYPDMWRIPHHHELQPCRMHVSTDLRMLSRSLLLPLAALLLLHTLASFSSTSHSVSALSSPCSYCSYCQHCSHCSVRSTAQHSTAQHSTKCREARDRSTSDEMPTAGRHSTAESTETTPRRSLTQTHVSHAAWLGMGWDGMAESGHVIQIVVSILMPMLMLTFMLILMCLLLLLLLCVSSACCLLCISSRVPVRSRRLVPTVISANTVSTVRCAGREQRARTGMGWATTLQAGR